MTTAENSIRTAKINETKFLGRLVLAYLYAVAGRTDDSKPMIEELKELSTNGAKWVSPFHIALIEEALRNRDSAIGWIEKAIEARDPWAMLLIDPRLEKMREDPRFQVFLQKIRTRIERK